jgi:hypothetical protein
VSQVLDYSAGFPGAQAIADAGYVGAARYVGFPGRRKCTTAGELADFTAHGLGMALVFEEATGNWRLGRHGGEYDAQRARAHANAIGFPADRPIYMAIDQDVVTSGEFDVMLDYLRGASGPLGGPGLTGVYGEADVIDHARDAFAAAWFWQTAAWSRGRRTEAHLYQHVGTVYVGGIACDTNEVMAADWGQHNAQEDDVQLSDMVHDVDKGGVLDTVDRTLYFTNKASWLAYNEAQKTNALLLAMQDKLTANQVATLAAISGIQTGSPTEQQMDALAERLGAELGADVAVELGRRLVGGTA